jgi:crotonobetaine/carnitine-CoA ligase
MDNRTMSTESFVEALAQMSPDQRRLAIEADPLPANIGQLLDQAAAEAGDTLAWNFFESGETITYRQLVREVNRTANALRAWGVARGDHLAVMLPNCPQMPTIWLALARLGAVMVPVNVRYTRRELRYILDDSEARFLIAHRDFASLLPPSADDADELSVTADRIALLGASTTDSIGRSWEDLARGQAETFVADASIGHDDLMNVQYTSGTTGFPKGCMLTHRYWLSASKVNGMRDGKRFERVLASTPFFYLDPQWLLLLAFHQRGTLYVAQRQSASKFAGWLREHRINFCLFPEVVFKQPPSPNDGLSNLRRANIYGVRKEVHPELRKRFNAPAMEAFGMTETGPTLFMPLEVAEMIGSGSCGVPTAFRECRIVDENGHDVARGEIGELIVRGPGMMLGYYKKPEANQASYFGEWFRTGDLFRQDDKGFFYIVGRLKDMVRRAGENIAAREVEAVLKNLPEVHDAAVVPVPDDLRGQEVKAYVVLQPHASANELPTQRIFDHCMRNLASFKVPRYLEFVASLPKTPSEKIAKSELIRAKSDLRVGAYDRVDGLWR